jgi:hypothetical protein
MRPVSNRCAFVPESEDLPGRGLLVPCENTCQEQTCGGSVKEGPLSSRMRRPVRDRPVLVEWEDLLTTGLFFIDKIC